MRLLVITSIFLISAMNTVLAAVATTTESFSLQHRPSEDIIPLVKPFLHPEGAISGSGYKLIIKTTGSNLTQIKKIISELDVELKRLRISISSDKTAIEKAISAQVNTPRGIADSSDSPNVKKIIITKGAQHKVTTKVFSTASRQHHPSTQNILVLEGQWAIIKAGNAVPYTERRTNPDGTVTEVIHYQKRHSGFRLRAHTSGNKAYLTIQPKLERAAETGGGATTYQELDTTITTELGHWIDIGGSESQSTQSSQGKTYSTQRNTEFAQGIYVKVEIAK